MRTDMPAGRRVVALLGLLVLLVYANALRTGFTFDDEPDIRNNKVVTGGVDLVEIFASPLPPGDLYRPVTVLTFALNERLAPGNAALYHAVNIVLHAAVTVLVFLLALRLFESTRVAMLAGVLFAVHPIHTEAVTSLVGRAELLAALFGLLTLLSVPQLDAPGPSGRRLARHAVSVICFSVAMLCKESALVVLPLIPLFRIACRRAPWRAAIWKELRSLDWMPYALCAAVVLLLRFVVVGGVRASTVTPLDNVLAFVPASVRVRSALGVLWDYFALLNIPLVLGADYSYAQVPIISTWTSPRFLAGLGVIAAAAAVLARDRRPAVTFAVALAVCALSLTSNVLFPIGTIKGERLLYLSSAGWVLIVAYGLDGLLDRPRYRRIAAALLVTVVAGYAARTWIRNWDWIDNTTLYHSMARSAPNSAKSRYNLGVAFQREEADAEAIVQFRRALDIYPYGGGAGSALGIGIIYEKQGLTDRAVEWYQKALDIEPSFDKAHTDLCHVLLSDKRFKQAVRACRRGLRYDPTDANLMKGLGEALVGNDEIEKGTEVMRRSLVLNPDDQELRTRLAQLDALDAHAGVAQ